MNRYEINNDMMKVADIRGKVYTDLLTCGKFNY